MDNYPATYFIEKSSGTLGDALLAYGVSKFISHLLPPGQGIDVRLTDRGSTYVIQLEGINRLPAEWINDLSQPPSLLQYIGTPKTLSACPPFITPLDYEEKKKVRDSYWEWRNDLSTEDKRRVNDLAREQGIQEPDPHLPLWILINTQKAIKSYNKLVVTWHAHREYYPQLAHLILILFGSFPNPVEQTFEGWQRLAEEAGIDAAAEETATQIINPGLGKGGHQFKAHKLTEKNLNAFWLTEYLRYVGLFEAGMPVVIQGSKDRKTYVPLPCDMKWQTVQTVLPGYRRSLWGSTAVKSDILAVLRYMHVYLDDWIEAQEDADTPPWAKSQPGDHASAIAVAFYKDMGSSHAMMDMSLLALPRWMPDPRTKEEVNQYLSLIDEHLNIIRNLDEKRGEEFAMLRLYRRFLTSGDLRDFLEFCARLGALAMSLLNNNDVRERSRARVFNLATVERIIMMTGDLSYYEIFQVEGFQRIANAIRHTTYLPQFFKSRGQAGEYQPEYGLGHKLLQSAVRPSSFMKELGEFVHRYQAETLRKMEHPRNPANKGQPRRSTISAEDLADIAQLVDVYGSNTVAALLVAAGYSRSSRQKSEEEPTELEAAE
ncbi:MAG: hypothetical protein JXB07_01930 [Anaerolineae bacterium]|nr:hypothetical protein [Anaerolineae bacterium]